MGFFDRILRRAAPERRSGGVLGNVGFGPLSVGATVSARLAENLSTVMACVGAISSTIGTLPAFVYEAADTGRTESTMHPVARLIRRPNRRQTWPDWVEMMMAQTLLHGNGLSVLEYDGAGRITALIPVPWQNVLVTLLPNGHLAYDVIQYAAPFGGNGQPRRYLDDEVFHLKDRTDDSFLGRSRLARAPEVLANAHGLQEIVNGMWRNGVTPSGVLSAPGILNKEVTERLKQSFQDAYAGAGNARKTVVLEQGLTWEAISVSPEDAEVLASRRFTVEEICRLYQVPPPIVQDYSHGTFTNTAQAALWFAQLTLTPWVRKIEAEFARSVFGDGSDFHLEIDMSGLMRGDFAARWAAYATAIDKNILTADEIREAEGYNPRGEVANPAEGAI